MCAIGSTTPQMESPYSKEAARGLALLVVLEVLEYYWRTILIYKTAKDRNQIDIKTTPWPPSPSGLRVGDAPISAQWRES